MTRLEFSAPVKRAARARSGGVCECHRVPGNARLGCGGRLRSGNTFYEHVTPSGIGGSASLDNCAVLVKTCWRRKTAAYDLPLVAKAKRMQDRDIGIRRSWGREPMPGSRASDWKQKLGRYGRDRWERRV